jgi:hypothetical protein
MMEKQQIPLGGSFKKQKGFGGGLGFGAGMRGRGTKTVSQGSAFSSISTASFMRMMDSPFKMGGSLVPRKTMLKVLKDQAKLDEINNIREADDLSTGQENDQNRRPADEETKVRPTEQGDSFEKRKRTS